MKSAEKLYKFHVENLRAIESAMAQIDSALKIAIKEQRQDLVSSHTRLYSLLLGVWSECRLVKLLFEKNGFGPKEREYILGNKDKNTKYDQWGKALEMGFRKQYNIKKAKLNPTSLLHSVYTKYQTLLSILENDLMPIIEIRNKLAHGQWVYPLNSDQNEIAQEQMDFLREENLLTLRFRKTILSSLALTIHDLVVSQPTFERDFDIHFKQILTAKQNL
ncbi:MAG: hypothetical protein HYU84_04750, partial [Chloroflexi bacterium]|nr:hypothetical protein [Chloroflexota bacterium]